LVRVLVVDLDGLVVDWMVGGWRNCLEATEWETLPRELRLVRDAERREVGLLWE